MSNVVNDEGQLVQVEFVDEMHEMAFKQIVGFIEQRNALVAQSNAAHGDRESLAETLTETLDDPEIVAAREARDEAIMRLHALVTPKVNEIMENAEANAAGVGDRLKEIETKLRPALNYFKTVYGEESAKHLPKRIAQRGGASGGAGGKRIRGYDVYTVIDGETLGHDNFSALAKYLDLDTSDLQAKFYEAAGNPKALKDAPDEVRFEVTFTAVDEDDNETDETALVVAERKVPKSAVTEDVAPDSDQPTE